MTSRSKPPRFTEKWRRVTSSALASRWKARAKKDGRPVETVPPRIDVLEWLEDCVGPEPRCPYCSEQLTPKTIGFDHNHPLSRCGLMGLHNVDATCRRCNETKGNLTGPEFRNLRGSLSELPVEVMTDVLRRMRAGGKVLRRVAK